MFDENNISLKLGVYNISVYHISTYVKAISITNDKVKLNCFHVESL